LLPGSGALPLQLGMMSPMGIAPQQTPHKERKYTLPLESLG
jgi:hypothetical protein